MEILLFDMLSNQLLCYAIFSTQSTLTHSISQDYFQNDNYLKLR